MFTQEDKKRLNEWVEYFSFQPTLVYKWLLGCTQSVIGVFCGNQFGKTYTIARFVWDAILGVLPVEQMNIRPSDTVRIIRCASEVLPNDEEAEVKNTQYPALKKFIPDYFIKEDITIRKPRMVIADPQGGADVVIEFVSFGQTTQQQAGVQRRMCIAKGQRVLLSNGLWKNIENIEIGDLVVSSVIGGYSKNKQRVHKVIKKEFMDFKKTITFYCQKGLKFTVTPDHLILKSGSPNQWIQAGELKIGDTLVCADVSIDNKVDTLNRWELITMAALIGDGHYIKKSVYITNKNDAFIEGLKKELNGIVNLVRANKNQNRTPQYRLSFGKNNPVIKLLKRQKMWGRYAKEKVIPDEVFCQSDKSVRLFLSWLYATDGWASGHDVGYATTSERLAQDVFLLLRRLGIKSNVYEREFMNNWNKQWHVHIQDSLSVIKFCENIGIPYKMDALNKVKEDALRRRYSKSKSIYPVRERKKVKIKNIEYSDVETEVFDLSLDVPKRSGKYHRMVAYNKSNFIIQGGIVAHNCFIDEHAPKPFYEEQIPRLMRASSDIRQIRGIDADALMIIALTPAQEFLDWEFDELFERAGTIYRTKSVRDRIQLRMSEIYPAKEIVDEQSQIAVIMASSYDNPSFDKVTVDKEMDKYADEDTKDIRGYGIFKQISGVVFKFFDRNVHVRDFEKLFQPFNGIPHDWVHARGIDFHQYNPWAVGWCCLSPQNEMFIYDELWVSPERHVTYDIAQMVSAKSKDYKYWLNLVDPLAGVKQGNTGRTTVDDLNEYFYMLYKEGIGTGGFWQTWDTKSQRGQDDIKMRLKNAKIVGRPFNNLVNGKYLPTIWISSRCHYTIEHMKNWRKEQVSNRNALVQNDPKDSAAEKYSHFNMVWEGILKSPAFSVNRYRGSVLHDRKQRREARA